MQPAKIAVVGAGSWGTVLAGVLAGGPGQAVDVALVARSTAVAGTLQRDRCNARYLPNFELPGAVFVTSSMQQAISGAEVVVMAVPSRWARQAMEALAPYREKGALLVSVAKGLEAGTLFTMSQVAAEVMSGGTTAVLGGPNLASEIALGLPAATVVACDEPDGALRMQRLMSSSRLRVYTHDDVIGCELAGAVKNVLAVGAGMVDGLSAGENAKAAMMTRGLAEMVRLGVAMGGHPLTFSGLAGLGDLVLTCTSAQSRNHQVGLALGQGRQLADVLSAMRQVAEGVTTAAPIVELAARHGLEMPISSQVAGVLNGSCTPAEAMGSLLGREPTHERAGSPLWPGWPARPAR